MFHKKQDDLDKLLQNLGTKLLLTDSKHDECSGSISCFFV